MLNTEVQMLQNGQQHIEQQEQHVFLQHMHKHVISTIITGTASAPT